MTSATRSMPEPGRSTISTIFMMSSAGKLSMTNQPTSSNAAAAVERPAPDIPVTTANSLIAPLLSWSPSLAHALIDGESDAVWQPRRCQQFLQGCRTDGVHPAELLDQARLAVGAQAGDVVENALGHSLAPALPVERDGEAVRLVAHPLQEVQRVGAAPQADRVGRPSAVDLLELLGQRRQLDLALEPELAQNTLGHAELALAAVDEQEVGPV